VIDQRYLLFNKKYGCRLGHGIGAANVKLFVRYKAIEEEAGASSSAGEKSHA
jgi:hypothetical protein